MKTGIPKRGGRNTETADLCSLAQWPLVASFVIKFSWIVLRRIGLKILIPFHLYLWLNHHPGCKMMTMRRLVSPIDRAATNGRANLKVSKLTCLKLGKNDHCFHPSLHFQDDVSGFNVSGTEAFIVVSLVIGLFLVSLVTTITCLFIIFKLQLFPGSELITFDSQNNVIFRTNIDLNKVHLNQNVIRGKFWYLVCQLYKWSDLNSVQSRSGNNLRKCSFWSWLLKTVSQFKWDTNIERRRIQDQISNHWTNNLSSWFLFPGHTI